LSFVPLIPLYGHATLRARLEHAISRGALPASLLLHGPRGVGKQRLALWLGQRLLCAADGTRPCGQCVSCRYALQLTHPDLRWFFPRPRSDDADPAPQEVLDDYAEAAAARAAAHGLYSPPSGMEAIYLSAVRALVKHAVYTPTISARKVIVVGDAERMVAQDGKDEAANAFLKLLEEPPADTVILLTTSEPGALLPTIRSRVAAVRVAPLPERDVRAWLADPAVRDALDHGDAPRITGVEARVEFAAGAPGALLAATSREESLTAARGLLDALTADRATQVRTIFALGGTKARGFFADMLDALTVVLHQRARDAVTHNDPHGATAACQAIDAVQAVRQRTGGNPNPQLLGAALVRQLQRALV
jgi:DNA polymerase-3 subunit delta'